MFHLQPDTLFSNNPVSSPRRKAFLDLALQLGELLLQSEPYAADPKTHAPTLINVRARHRAIVTLAGLYRITGDPRYAERAWFQFEDALERSPWLLELPVPLAFDLGSGEAAISLALLWDWMQDWMSEAQKALLLETAENEIFKRYLEAVPVDPTQERHWWHKTDMNWNSVCNGGPCALAYLLQEESPYAADVSRVAMEGLQVYMDSLPADGSSEESIGYWAFGNLYLFYALSAWERYHQKAHPFLEGPYYARGIAFLLDFSPRGCAIGFGDSNKANLCAWMISAAKRCGRRDLAAEVSERLLASSHPEPCLMPLSQEAFPTELFAALVAEEPLEESVEPERLLLYPHNGWALFRSGPLSLSFQGGSTKRYHSMRDALAIFVERDGQVMIDSPENHPYPRGWFDQLHYGERGHSRELYWEEHSLSKSAPCINGVGQACKGDPLWTHGPSHMESDATELYPWFMDEVRRRVELREDGFLISDFFRSSNAEFYECRWITEAEVEAEAEGWRLRRGDTLLRLKVEASVSLSFHVEQRLRSIASRGSVTLLRCIVKEAQLQTQIRTRILCE